mgnify:CR=1 FL=1|tara:strand:- start:145 stop:525 length:381 start_codon:yes stop_codon:yes gene_type:complete
MIDTDKYEGHTEGPWSIYSPVTQVTKKYRDDNEGKLGLPMSDWLSYGVAGVGPCTMRRYMNDPEPIKTWHANIHLVADAPLLLEEVKRLREEIKDYDACLQNLWDNELIPDDTDIWDEVKELLEVD